MVNCADHAYTVWLMVNEVEHSVENQIKFAGEVQKMAAGLEYQVVEALTRAKAVKPES